MKSAQGVDSINATDIIRTKRDGRILTDAEIAHFVGGTTSDTWTDYQLSAMLMAIFLRGMSDDETAHLTRAMVQSGVRLDWSDLPGPTVDKHSTGGVGDKTSPILAPLVAACGAYVPMMSGRGLGHSGGTLDKLESIPGFRVRLSLGELRAALHKVGCALIGQTDEVAPADKKLYALRDVTATVESIPLITASIMSKKIAEGIDALVLDVKCGAGAFMKSAKDAQELARSLVRTGNANAVPTEAVLSEMSFPLGRAVGNALEIRECIEILKNGGDGRLTFLSIILAARMLAACDIAQDFDCAKEKIQDALRSGSGVEKLREIIVQQGGDAHVVDDTRLLPQAPKQTLVRADRPGYVAELHAEKVGRAAMELGAGRRRAEDDIDPAAGVVLQVTHGEHVKEGDAFAELHFRDEKNVDVAKQLLHDALALSDKQPRPLPLVLGTVGDA